jgi:hypothetical protein
MKRLRLPLCNSARVQKHSRTTFAGSRKLIDKLRHFLLAPNLTTTNGRRIFPTDILYRLSTRRTVSSVVWNR